MELRTLRYFTVVAQELNITRAAEKLSMSQPPLSSQMRSLEEELGVQLFYRGKRRLELTQAGTMLQRRSMQILDLTEKTRQELTALKDGISGNYLAMHRAGLFPNSYDFDESGWPIEKRTAYHMSMSAEIINTFDQMYPDKPLKISGLPDANEMIANGLEATLKSLA